VTRRRIRLALVVYGALALLALVWGWLRGDANLYHHPAPWWDLGFPAATLVSLGAGLAVAAAVIVATRVLVRRARWARDLHTGFRELLGPLSGAEIAVFALTSGIAEEMFFRGAMQPALGLWATSVIFGLMHVGPIRKFWAWTLWAAVMGLVFGAIHEATGDLLGPVVAHILINYENLHFIERYDPHPREGGDRRTPSEPRLVSSRRRADQSGSVHTRSS